MLIFVDSFGDGFRVLAYCTRSLTQDIHTFFLSLVFFYIWMNDLESTEYFMEFSSSYKAASCSGLNGNVMNKMGR